MITIWMEDECAPDAERVEQAWERIFGSQLDLTKALNKEDLGDAMLYTMANHAVVSFAPDGASIEVPQWLSAKLAEQSQASTMRIHKYHLHVGGNTFTIPGGEYTILSAGAQGEVILLWVEVDAGSGIRGVNIIEVEVVPTGGTPPRRSEGWAYLSTILQHDGALVWHVYTKERS